MKGLFDSTGSGPQVENPSFRPFPRWSCLFYLSVYLSNTSTLVVLSWACVCTCVCCDVQMSSGVNSSPVKALLLLPHLSPVECKQRGVGGWGGWLAICRGGNESCPERMCGETVSFSSPSHTRIKVRHCHPAWGTQKINLPRTFTRQLLWFPPPVCASLFRFWHFWWWRREVIGAYFPSWTSPQCPAATYDREPSLDKARATSALEKCPSDLSLWHIAVSNSSNGHF